MDTIFGHFAIVDIESYRECMGYFTASAQKVPVAKENQNLLKLDDANLDSLFGSGSLVVDNQKNNVEIPAVAHATPAQPLTAEEIENGVYNLDLRQIQDVVSPGKALTRSQPGLAEGKIGMRSRHLEKSCGHDREPDHPN